MKVKAIIVDEVPQKCQDCPFGNKPIEKGEYCSLEWNSAVKSNTCPLITEEDFFSVDK